MSGIESVSSWILVRFITTEPQQEHPDVLIQGKVAEFFVYDLTDQDSACMKEMCVKTD